MVGFGQGRPVNYDTGKKFFPPMPEFELGSRFARNSWNVDSEIYAAIIKSCMRLKKKN